MPYKSQSARDAQAANYGNNKYWQYLDALAQEHYDYFMQKGQPENAQRMFTRPLSEALRGNDGD